MAERAVPGSARTFRKTLGNAKWGLMLITLLYLGAATVLSDHSRGPAFAETDTAYLIDLDLAARVLSLHNTRSRPATLDDLSSPDDLGAEPAVAAEPEAPAPEPEAAQEPEPEPVAVASAPLPARAPVQPAPVQPAPAPRPASPPAPTPAPAVGVSSLASQLLTAHNAERARVGLGALSYDGALAAVAQRRASDMASRNYFGHVSPTGETAYSLMDAAGIRYATAGENLAWTSYPEEQVFSQCMSSWLASPSHAANIRNAAYTRVGFGVGVSGGKTYIAAVFAGP